MQRFFSPFSKALLLVIVVNLMLLQASSAADLSIFDSAGRLRAIAAIDSAVTVKISMREKGEASLSQLTLKSRESEATVNGNVVGKEIIFAGISGGTWDIVSEVDYKLIGDVSIVNEGQGSDLGAVKEPKVMENSGAATGLDVAGVKR